MTPLFNYLVPIASALAASLFFCLIIMRFGIVDRPDGGRKTQVRAVPSAGGVAIACALGIGLFIANVLEVGWHWSLTTVRPWWPFLLPLPALLIGLLDDAGLLSTRLKFGALAVFAIWAGWMFGPLEIQLPVVENLSFSNTHPGIDSLIYSQPPQVPNWPVYLCSLLGAALWIFVFVNAANFIDGSNGLALGSLAIMLFAILAMEAYSPLVSRRMILIAAILGFLFWNLQGKLYAGDAGSLFVGAAVGIASLQLVRNGHHSIFTPATLALPFLIDVLLTLIWRFRRGRNLLHAHLDHAYQLLRRSGWGHLQVASLWWAMTAVCAVAAVLADRAGGDAPFWVWFALLLNGSGVWMWQRRVYGQRVKA